MKRLFKFVRLPANEKKFFFQSLYYLVFYRIRLITASPQELFASVSRRSTNSSYPTLRAPSTQRIAGIINAAAKLIPVSTCLSKALAGYILFAQNGQRTKLHIGVTKDKEQMLEAHAWLSLNGDIILGKVPQLDHFRELPLDLIKDLS